MTSKRVRLWLPRGEERVLLMSGQTTGYRIEYVFGVVGDRPMLDRRGRRRRLVEPGRLVACDPWIPTRARPSTAGRGAPA